MNEKIREHGADLMHKLTQVTASVCEAVEQKEFGRAAELLSERSRLLGSLATLKARGLAPFDKPRGAEAAGTPPPILLHDSGMLKVIKAQRKEILEKLQETRKRKSITMYSR